MLIVFAPLLTLAAMLAGSIATIVAIVLNGPRSLRRRGEPPLVVLPPVPTPDMHRLVEEEQKALVAL